MQILSRIFLREDSGFDALVESHRAESGRSKLFFLAMHLIPGILAYLGIFHLREPLMEIGGLSNRNAQALVLLSMALGWHIVLPFCLLRFKDGLSFKESLKFLGLANLDFKGFLVVLPIVAVAFTLLSVPYMARIHPPLFEFLNSFSAITIQDWHVYEIGYYSFPLPLLMVVFIANFFGEEIYFRGYLLQKISGIKGDWAVNSLLFQFYHVWQAPLNWAFAPMFLFIPMGILVKLRRSLYGAILFHVFINSAWGMILYSFFGVE